MAGWNADTAAGPLGAGTVTIVEGSSFCISLPNGDIKSEHPHGVFVQDTRILSGWVLTVNGQAIEPLAAETKEPYRALFAGRVPRLDGYADSPLIVERLREVGAGIQEQISLRNYSKEPAACVISLTVEADFADLFEVKEARIQRRWDQTRHVDGDSLTIRAYWQEMRKGIHVQAWCRCHVGGPHVQHDGCSAWQVEFGPYRGADHGNDEPATAIFHSS